MVQLTMQDNHAPCIPAELAADTVESLFAAHGHQRPVLYWLLLSGILAGLVSLPLVKVDVSVRASGLVRSTTDLAELKTAVTGHIAEAFVTDNTAVRTGQPLLRLESPDLEQRLSRNRAEQAERSAIVADLRQLTALSDGIPDGQSRPGFPAAVLLTPPGALLNASWAEQDRQAPFSPTPTTTAPEHIAPQTALVRQEWSQFRARTDTYRLAESKARGELARYTNLAAKGIATQQELENARYEVERLVSESQLISEQTQAQWQNRLREENTLLESLRTEEKRLLVEQRLYTLHAPVDGILVGLTGIGPGRLVFAGQVLGTISPTDALKVEAYIPPQDIGLIRVGQRARLQVDAFPYTQWGTLEGVVESISGDALTAANGASAEQSHFQRAFVAIVQPYQNALRLPNGTRGQLKKGMTLSVRFLTARRSILQLIHEDASLWLDPQRDAYPANPHPFFSNTAEE